MASSRKERVDALLTQLVTQLEAAVARPGGLTAAEAGVLLALHRHAVGGDTDEVSALQFSKDELAVIHELARKEPESGT